MKRFSIALLALAMVLAISPAAMAYTCSTDLSPITTGTVCTEGSFTITFINVSVVGGTGSLYFNAGTTYSDNSVELLFQWLGSEPADINLDYEVQGPAGVYQLDNSFLGLSANDSITEIACTGNPHTACGTQLASIRNTTSGVEAYSGKFVSNGTFYIDKDIEDWDFSEFTDSIELAPEPSSLIMFGTGLLGLAGMLRYKFRKSS